MLENYKCVTLLIFALAPKASPQFSQNQGTEDAFNTSTFPNPRIDISSPTKGNWGEDEKTIIQRRRKSTSVQNTLSNGPKKSNTYFIRQTTTVFMKTTLDDLIEHIGNSERTHDKQNNTNIRNNAMRKSNPINFTGEKINSNTLHTSVTNGFSQSRTGQQKTPPKDSHTNENNTNGDKNQNTTQNPRKSITNINNIQITQENHNNERITSSSNTESNSIGTESTYHTGTILYRVENAVTKSANASASNAHGQEKIVTLNSVTQTKKIVDLKTEQSVSSPTTSRITVTNQSVSIAQGKSVTFQQNDNVTKPQYGLDTRNTDQPTSTSRTRTEDNSLHWKNSSKRGGGNTVKEPDKEDHATTPVLTKRRTVNFDSSSVLAATLGGVFVGGLLVFAMFYCKKRITRYIRGDYRRLPLEYDFELNPRLKYP